MTRGNENRSTEGNRRATRDRLLLALELSGRGGALQYLYNKQEVLLQLFHTAGSVDWAMLEDY